jgi:hypothetical protein
VSELRETLLELFPRDEQDDWDNVMRRAGRPTPSARRFMLALAAVALLTLAVGSALALSGKLGNLFHGTPVKDLTPRERFFLSESDLNGKVELLAKRNGDAFYIIKRADGTRCYFIGDARRNLTPAQREGRIRFGGGGCIDPRVFPGRAVPVLDQSYYSYHRGDSESRLAGLQGFAADPVDRIGVIGRDNQIIFTLKVEQNVYTAGRRGFMGARGIVALDAHGRVLWVQCTAMGRSPAPQFPSGGCGKYKTTPPPNLPPRKVPRRPIEAPGPLVVQHGAGDGVTVEIRGSRITANFANISVEKRALLRSKNGKIGFGCFKLVRIGGGQTETTGAYSTKPFTDVVRLRPYNPFGPNPRPPFDACTAMGQYGHTWNDAHGTHDTIEIALTQRGRVYLADRAVERDIEWLARARVFRDVRYALRPFTSESAASWLGSHVVPLRTAGATPPAGKLGIWIGPERRIVLAERTASGRRLYLELRRGISYRTNLY